MRFLIFLFAFQVLTTEIPDHVRDMLVHQYKWKLAKQSGNITSRDTVVAGLLIKIVEADDVESMGYQVVIQYDSTRYSIFQKRYFVIENEIRFLETYKVDTAMLAQLQPRAFLWEVESHYFSKKGDCSMDICSLFIDEPIPTQRDSTIMFSGWNDRTEEWDREKRLCREVLELNEWILEYVK